MILEIEVNFEGGDALEARFFGPRNLYWHVESTPAVPSGANRLFTRSHFGMVPWSSEGLVEDELGFGDQFGKSLSVLGILDSYECSQLVAVLPTFLVVLVEVADFKLNIDHIRLFGKNLLDELPALLIFLWVFGFDLSVELFVDWQDLWTLLPAKSTLWIRLDEVVETVLAECVTAWSSGWLDHDSHADRTAWIKLFSPLHLLMLRGLF